MVGLAIVLAMFFGLVVFQKYDNPATPAPGVAFDYEYDRADERLTVTHESGRSVPDAELYVVVRAGNGSVTETRDWDGSGTVSAGDALVIEGVGPDYTATAVREQSGEQRSYVVGEWRGPEA